MNLGEWYTKTRELKEAGTCYKKAYEILMEYWDLFPEEERKTIDKRLQECGL